MLVEIRVLPMTTLTNGVLHAKYMVVDGTSVFVGSQNWDWRALEGERTLSNTKISRHDCCHSRYQ